MAEQTHRCHKRRPCRQMRLGAVERRACSCLHGVLLRLSRFARPAENHQAIKWSRLVSIQSLAGASGMAGSLTLADLGGAVLSIRVYQNASTPSRQRPTLYNRAQPWYIQDLE